MDKLSYAQEKVERHTLREVWNDITHPFPNLTADFFGNGSVTVSHSL